MTRLTRNQTDMLIAVGLDCVLQYAALRYEGEVFALSIHRAIGALCPAPCNPTSSGRSLIRLGLVIPFADNPDKISESYCRAALTDDGKAAFDPLFTPEMRAALEQHRAEERMRRREDEARRRKNAWLDRHYTTFVELRDRDDARRDERLKLERERNDIAMTIGRGANDTDDLVERLRVIVRRLDALSAEDAADDALRPVYEDEQV